MLPALRQLSFKSRVLLLFAIIIAVNAIISGYIFFTFTQMHRSFDEVSEAYEEVRSTFELTTQLGWRLTALERYIDTKDPIALSTYRQADVAVAQALATIKELDANNPAERAQLTLLSQKLEKLHDVNERALSLIDSGQEEEADDLLHLEAVLLHQDILFDTEQFAKSEDASYLALFGTISGQFLQTLSSVIILSVIFGLVGMVVSIIISRSVTEPLKGLVALTEKVKKGDLSVRAQVTLPSQDEIGKLAIALNDMITHLQMMYFQMEEKVQEKTKEIQSRMGETEKQNEMLESTKRAMLNLLEDARISEEKVQKQAAELQKALSETARFGAIADQERNTYLLLLSSIGEGVLVLDTNRNVTIINRVAEQILGYTQAELVGKHFADLLSFMHKDKQVVDQNFWDTAFRSQNPLVFPSDLSVIRKDKHVIPIDLVISPIFDKKTNEFKGVIMTFRDVREERALEEARISFISVASHQLRTPLTSMRWFAEMLVGGDAGTITDEQKHFVERIYQGTDRMIALVNLLLQIARVEAGRVKIEPTPVDLKATTNGVLLTLKANLEQKQQKVEIATNPDPFPLINMDQEVIWQVIQNLVSNAIRYSHDRATIWISVEKQDDMAIYSVKDEGIGIPKDQQDRIFEKFFRAENALKMVPEGSGLGISLVKLLVEGWNGKIWFESEEGHGSTFHVSIPLSGQLAKEGEVKLAV